MTDINNFTRDLEDKISSILKNDANGYSLYIIKDGTITGGYKLIFRDDDMYIYSSIDGTLKVVSDIILDLTAPTLDINASSGVDVSHGLTVNGALSLKADSTIDTNKKFMFRNGNTAISSKADTFLDIDATGTVRINASLLIQKSINYGTTTNSGNAYSLSVGIGDLTDGQTVIFKANAASTGSATLNVNGKGAKLLYLSDQTTQVTKELVQNNQYHTIYNSSLNTGSGGWWITNL